jgi:hypothetical protein
MWLIVFSLFCLSPFARILEMAPPDENVTPYGLKKADLGAANAPNFLRAVLGEGKDAEQDAAITAWAMDRQENVDELQQIADRFKRKEGGVQAVVWRDTRTGKCKRAGGTVEFDPDRDRIELLFVKLDLEAIKGETAKAPNPPTDESQAWVKGIAEAERKAAKGLRAGQGLAGPLGGSGDFRAGNIVPLYQGAKEQIGETESAIRTLAKTVRTRPTVVVLVAYRYDDGKSRIPSKVQYLWAVEGSGVYGVEAENK